MTKTEKKKVAFRLGDSGEISQYVGPLLSHIMAISQSSLPPKQYSELPPIIKKVWGFGVVPKFLEGKELKEIESSISSEGLKGQEPLAALLAISSDPDQSTKFYQSLVANVFWATCRELELGHHRHSLVAGVNRARIDDRILNQLDASDGEVFSWKEVRDTLKLSNSIKWAPIITLINDGKDLKRKKKIRKRKRISPPSGPEKLAKGLGQVTVVCFDPPPSTESAGGDYERRLRSYRVEEKYLDSPPDTEYMVENQESVSATFAYRADPELDDALPGEDERRAQGRKNSKQKCAAACSLGKRYPTDSEISHLLWNWLEENCTPGSTICAASVLSGKTTEWWAAGLSVKEKWESDIVVSNDGKYVGVKVSCGCPNLTESQRSSGMFVPVDDWLVWWLPERVSKLLLRVKQHFDEGTIAMESVLEDAESALGGETEKKKIKLSVSRASRVLERFLGSHLELDTEDRRKTVDEAVVARVLARNQSDHPQTFYTIIEQSEIAVLGEKFYQELSRISGIPLSWPKVERIAGIAHGRAGSQRVLRSTVVKDRFEGHYKDLAHLTESPLLYLSKLAELIYDANCIAEMSRSTNGRLYDRKLISLELGVSYVDDKAVRGHGRANPLPKTMIELLRQWEDTLHLVRSIYRGKYPEIGTAIDAALDGTGPYLFSIVGPELKIQELDIEFVTEHVYRNFDVPLNWGRHFTRNVLRLRAIRLDILDDFAGHPHRSSSVHDRFSCGNHAAIRDIAVEIDRIMTVIGITADIPRPNLSQAAA